MACRTQTVACWCEDWKPARTRLNAYLGRLAKLSGTRGVDSDAAFTPRSDNAYTARLRPAAYRNIRPWRCRRGHKS